MKLTKIMLSMAIAALMAGTCFAEEAAKVEDVVKSMAKGAIKTVVEDAVKAATENTVKTDDTAKAEENKGETNMTTLNETIKTIHQRKSVRNYTDQEVNNDTAVESNNTQATTIQAPSPEIVTTENQVITDESKQEAIKAEPKMQDSTEGQPLSAAFISTTEPQTTDGEQPRERISACKKPMQVTKASHEQATILVRIRIRTFLLFVSSSTYVVRAQRAQPIINS